MAVEPAQIVILFRAHLNYRDVAQFHFRTVLIDAQRDIPELFRCFQQRLGINGGVQRLIIHGRRAAQLADGDLAVLRFDGVHHILGGELIANQLAGLQPDAH